MVSDQDLGFIRLTERVKIKKMKGCAVGFLSLEGCRGGFMVGVCLI